MLVQLTDTAALDLRDLMEALEEDRLEEIYKCQESPLYFMKAYGKVITKKGEVKDFIPNKIQKIVYKGMKEKFFRPFAVRTNQDGTEKVICRFQKARVAVAKPRQVGISTYFIFLILHDFLFWKYSINNITLHKAEYSSKLLGRLKKMLELIPDFLKPDKESDDHDSTGKITFKQTGSEISVGSPGKSEEISGDQGRSETLSNALISEMPRYPYADVFFQAMSAAFKEGNCYVESTPLQQGDLFHRLVIKGLGLENKEGSESLVDEDLYDDDDNWLGFFFPWVYHDEYQLPIRSAQERERIRESLTTTEKDLFIRFPKIMNEERIKWRRVTIRDDFDNNEYAFQIDYPEDIDTAFATTGKCYFMDPNIEIKKVLTTEEPPDPDDFYAIGVDCAKGLGGNNDYSVITVVSTKTGRQVYTYRSNKISDKALPHKILEVWNKYPGFIGVESNNDVGGSVMTTLRYVEGFTENKILQKMIYCSSNERDGFYTTQAKKAVIMSLLYTALKNAAEIERDRIAFEQQPDGPEFTPDYSGSLRLSHERTKTELGMFMDFGGNVLGANKKAGNHDDCVIAVAIANYIIPYALRAKDRYREMKREQEKQKQDREKNQNPDIEEAKKWSEWDDLYS